MAGDCETGTDDYVVHCSDHHFCEFGILTTFFSLILLQMPLSFIASVLGMNVAELNGGNLTIRQDFSYMCKLALPAV
jgi:hypothetical protein